MRVDVGVPHPTLVRIGWLGVCSVALVATSPRQTYVISLFNPSMQRIQFQVARLLATVEMPEITVEPGWRVRRDQERAARKASKRWQFWT